MRLGRTLIVVLACSVFATQVEARPRLFKVLGALATAPVAVIAGAARAPAHHRHHRVARVRRAPVVETRTERRSNIAGWEGPVFWPYAYDDIFDYVLAQANAADRFWAHGYNDVMDGMFVTAALSATHARRGVQVAENSGAVPNWQSLCGSQNATPAEALAERIRHTVQVRPEQTKALDDLQAALARASERIRSTCPEQPTTNATRRFDLMASRLMAMRQALAMVNTPLKNFYAVLDDEQKSRLNAGGATETGSPEPASKAPPSGALGCAEAASEGDWPTEQLARRVQPRREQYQDLEILRGTSDVFAKFVAKTCLPEKAQTAPERLNAAQKRVEVLRHAVRHVSPALELAYAGLTPQQRLRFSTLGR